MRILYLSQTSPPEPGPTKRPLRQARALNENGHRVTLITARPNYPLGRVHPGYRGRLFLRETLDGVDVLRVWNLPAPNRGTIRRVLGFLSFAFSAVVAGLLVDKPQCVIASIPKPLTELAGWMLARIRRAMFVVEVRDVLPDSLLVTNVRRTSILYRMLRSYYGWIYRRADLFILVSPAMEAQLADYGAAATPKVLLPHGVELEELETDRRDDVRRMLGISDHLAVMYAGSFSRHYRVPDFLEVARLLSERRPSIRMILVGTGADFEEVRQAVQTSALQNVVLTGGVAPDEMPGYLQAADVFLFPQLHPDVLYGGTKIVEYLAAGRPVVCISSDPASGEAERLGIGLSARLGAPASIAAAIETLADDAGLRMHCGNIGREIARSRDRKTLVAKLSNALRSYEAGES